MIDIAWSEFLFIALLALILIGPKELPFVLRNIGRWVGKARSIAKAFSTQLDLHSHLEDPWDNKEQEEPLIQSNDASKTPPVENKK